MLETEGKPKKITLSDGKEYTLSPINLNVLADIETEMGCSLNELEKKFNKSQASSLRTLLYVLLKPNHPEITPEDVGKLVSVNLISEVSEAIGEVIKELS